MAEIDTRVQQFLNQKRIAVVGVSERRQTGCNLAYRRFKEAGYAVWPINPHLQTFDGDPCFPDLRSTPERPDAVFLFTNPQVTDHLVDQCIELGIGHVWMHCMLGTKAGLGKAATSVSPTAAQKCESKGINVIPGACPNQFLNPDLGHGAMRGLFRLFGFMRLRNST